MSHILHFYHLAAVDYIDTNVPGSIIANTAPWSPRISTDDMVGHVGGTTSANVNTLVGHYVAALNIRRKAHEAGAWMDGKHPHTPALIPGGVTSISTSAMTAAVSALLGDADDSAATGTSIRSFIKNVYLQDVVFVAKALSGTLLAGSPAQGVGEGCKKYLAYGTFPDPDTGVPFISGGFLDTTTDPWGLSGLNQTLIKEQTKYSKYEQTYTNLHPSVGVTAPEPAKEGAYSWLKAPRYNGSPAEVGPLARVLVNYVAGNPPWVDTVNLVMTGADYLARPTTGEIPNLRSVLGRHAARAIEAYVVAEEMVTWLGDLGTTTATGQTYKHRDIPSDPVTAFGLTEAPRGALGHWMRIDGRKISNYQCVVPTTWNACPRDDSNVAGPIEQALVGITTTGLAVTGTGDTTGDVLTMKAVRIIRSFDPCIACAVHIVTPDKKEVKKFELPSP